MENLIPVMGRITADPELRYTQSGLAVVNLTIASNQRIFDRQANEFKDGEATFLRASAWRTLAENIAATLHKGNRVITYGRLQQKSYETKEGEKRTYVELQIEDIGPSLKFDTARITSGTAATPEPEPEPWGSPAPDAGSFSDDTPF